MSDDDRILRLVGIALLAFIAFGLVTGVLAAMNPDIGSSGPDETDWSVERVNESYVQITYEDGPPIPTDELVVSSGGTDRRVTWEDFVAPGDTGEVRASDGQVVVIYWTEGEGSRDILHQERV